MEKYIGLGDITALMKIFIKPITKSMRYSILNELSPEQKKEVEEKVFLQEKEYPPRRGRPSKYDFLYVFVTDIEEAGAEKVKGLLVEKTGRSVFYYFRTWRELRGYAFLLPWRSPVDGKALPNKLRFFDGIRKEIMEAFEKPEISNYGKVQEKEEKEAEHERKGKGEKDELVSEELIQEENVEENKREEEREEIKKAIDILKKQKEKLEKEIASLERMGWYMPTYRSKKKRLQKELKEVNAKIRVLRAELTKL